MSLTAYRDAFEALQWPAAECDARATSLQRFLDQGFPSKKQEEWRYTDLSALARQSFAPAAPAPALALDAWRLEGSDVVVFTNGRRDDGTPAAAPIIASPEHPVAALNRAFATDGLQLTLAAGERLDRPLQVITWCGGHNQPHMAHLAHRIALGEGASARVVFVNLGDESETFTTQVIEVELAEGSELELYRVQANGAKTYALDRTDARLARDASLHYAGLELGGRLVRHDLNAAVAGPGAAAGLYGLNAPAGKTHLDVHTRIDHLAPHGRSREEFRGVIADAAHAVFNGKIVVHQDAQKTDSEQRVAHLLASRKAEVNAKPELEIYADDVKCAHGATVGRLDETAVYYLRSRGLPETMARSLLTFAFAHEVLRQVGDDALRRLMERAWLTRLPDGAALEELL